MYSNLLKYYKLLKKNNIIFSANNKSDSNNNKFSIVLFKCKICGLFSYYLNYLKCIIKVISLGYIPIVDLSSFPNIFNRFHVGIIKYNPWEIFFNQPFGYKLKDIKKKYKSIKYFNCRRVKIEFHGDIYINKVLMDFWHSMAIKYIPIKKEIIKESNKIKKKLFKNSNNILGILARGTDYISLKPQGHNIPPSSEVMLRDIKQMNKMNKYDYFFLSTEDDLIREKFIYEFKNKLKYLKACKSIDYNYRNKKYLSLNININGKINFMKIYLINIIIMSQCIDVIVARTCGSKGLFILSNGFRYAKVYNLGLYK